MIKSSEISAFYHKYGRFTSFCFAKGNSVFVRLVNNASILHRMVIRLNHLLMWYFPPI
jgi:hypothetical protein